MGTTYYYTVNDEIIGEHTFGQSRLDYVTDALGSVISTVDQTLSVQSTARYKPYGAILSETGNQPRYGYVGSPGYRATGVPHSELYVRLRHVSTTEARWTTPDPIWPWQLCYAYVRSMPTSIVDPWGDSPPGRHITVHSPPGDRLKSAISDGCAIVTALKRGDVGISVSYQLCVGNSGCPEMTDTLITCLYNKLCKGVVSVILQNIDTCPGCQGNCGQSFPTTKKVDMCQNQLLLPECDHFKAGAPYHMVLLHELLHLCGVDHPDSPGWPGYPREAKCNNIMACCLLKAAGMLPPSQECQLPGPRNKG